MPQCPRHQPRSFGASACVARHTGHRILRLFAELAVTLRNAVDFADLLQAGPTTSPANRVLACRCRRSVRLTFTDGRMLRRAACLPLPLAVGGKSPPGTRPGWRL